MDCAINRSKGEYKTEGMLKQEVVAEKRYLGQRALERFDGRVARAANGAGLKQVLLDARTCLERTFTPAGPVICQVGMTQEDLRLAFADLETYIDCVVRNYAELRSGLTSPGPV